ncbi:MAG TPA: HAMP domain-containing sensor histidine kinase [Solirubrobacteraceae bacterium]|nr:HAMP domain-containing sensor histidine kinase [Solirubrobacteraceae bacterium]
MRSRALRRLAPASLRSQLALAIALVTAAGIAASFFALYTGTSNRLRSQIDSQLRTQAEEWRLFTAHADISGPAALQRTARRFIADQRYHAESLVIAVEVSGGQVVSNDTELIAQEAQRERSDTSVGLLDARTGLTTAQVAEAGQMRLLSVPIFREGRRIGTLRLANPLTPVSQAQSSMTRTFALVGAVVLLAAIALGAALAGIIAAPLRRMAAIASAVEGGDLSVRTGQRGRGEVGVLSGAFDDMLERLESTFRRQREFVSDASHELRTPLTVLRAQVELLDREPAPDAVRDAAAVLLRKLDELDRLVGDMLTLATAEAGQLIEPEEIDLADFLEDLRRDLPLFGERRFHLQPVDGTLRADPGRLTQVLRNLVRNAVAHTDPGDEIWVSARGAGARLEIVVRDSGPGIPPEQLERVFERFRRLPGGRARDSGGSGLGLAIARALVEAHGGRIWAAPSAGGAEFHIELPGYSGPQAGHP